MNRCKLYSLHLDAKFNNIPKSQISLKNPDLTHLFVRWESIRDHIRYDGPDDDSAYLAIIRSYNNLGWFKDADQCYYEYRKLNQSTKREWYHSSENKLIDQFIVKLIDASVELYSYPKIMIGDLIELSRRYPFNRVYKFDWTKLADHISGIFCGYGVKVERIILWMLGLILIFASFFKFSNAIYRTEWNLIPISSDHTIDSSFIDCLYFSAMTLCGQVPPNMQALGNWVYMVALERLIGYLLLALFMVVLTKKLLR